MSAGVMMSKFYVGVAGPRVLCAISFVSFDEYAV